MTNRFETEDSAKWKRERKKGGWRDQVYNSKDTMNKGSIFEAIIQSRTQQAERNARTKLYQLANVL